MSRCSFELPTTEEDLDRLIEKIGDCREKEEFDIALTLCQHLIVHESTRMAGYRERAVVWWSMSERDLALVDLRQLVALGSVEPVDYYNLGIALLRRTEAREAAAAFTRGIELGDEHGSSYYTPSCRFHRAAAYLQLGMANEALDDCRDIEDGYRCFLPNEGMRSKEDLVAQARRQLK